jgi:hypothetical protein
VRQRKDLLVSSLLDYVRNGALLRVVYYDLLDAPGTKLLDCLRPIHGTEPVRTRGHGRAACAKFSGCWLRMTVNGWNQCEVSSWQGCFDAPDDTLAVHVYRQRGGS